MNATSWSSVELYADSDVSVGATEGYKAAGTFHPYDALPQRYSL